MRHDLSEAEVRRRILRLLELDSRRTLGSIAVAADLPLELVVAHLRSIRKQYRFTIVPVSKDQDLRVFATPCGICRSCGKPAAAESSETQGLPQ